MLGQKKEKKSLKIFMMIFDEDDEDSQENKSEIKELTFEEVRCLEKLVKVLKNNKDTDSLRKP